jgi:hypothetical protein
MSDDIEDALQKAYAQVRALERSKKEAYEAKYAAAAARGFEVVTDSAEDAARYWGLCSWSPQDLTKVNCDVLEGPSYDRSSRSYAVVPRPGFEHLAVCTPERDRRRRNKEHRKERHVIFARIRRTLKRAT